MNSGDRQDPRWMILILIGGLSIAAWRTISTISLGQVLSAVGSLAPFALGTIAIASALAMQRLLSTNRTLASRQEVAVVPADDFDPKTDAVLRFAAELAATERSVFGWVDRRASAVRVRLTCDEEGRLVYLLGVPERSLKLLRGALRTYDGIELRNPKDVLGKRRAVEVSRPGFHGDLERRTFRPPVRRTSANASPEEVPRRVERARRPPRA